MAKRVEANWVKEHLNDGRTRIINVLGEEDYAKGHIPGTPNVPVNSPDFDKQIAEIVPDKSTPVVAYCASLTCESSPQAAQRLEELGFKEVYDFKAGMAGWKEAGYQVETSQPSARMPSKVGTEAEGVPTE